MHGTKTSEASGNRLRRRRYLQVATAGLVGVSTASTTGDAQTAASGGWPQYGYDAANTAAATGGNEPRDDANVDQAWWDNGISTLEDGQTGNGVAVHDETVYLGTRTFGDGGEVFAVPTSGGEPRWRVETPGLVDAVPAVREGSVFVTTSPSTEEYQTRDPPGSLYALDAATGGTDWTIGAAGDDLSDPVLAGDRVVFTATRTDLSRAEETHVYAVSATDGTVEWSASHDGMASTTPAVADGTVYVPVNPSITGSDPGTLYAYDIATGDERALAQFPYGITTPPTVADGTVYVGVGYSLDDVGMLYALDADSGESRWVYEAERSFTESVAVGGDTVVLSTDRVEALDRESGERRWEFRTDFLPGPPAIAGGTVFVQRDRVYAIDLEDGTDLWNRSTGTASVVPAVVGDTVYTVGYNSVQAFTETGPATPEPPGEETITEQRGGDDRRESGGSDPVLERSEDDDTAVVGLLAGLVGLGLGAATAAYRDRSNEGPPGPRSRGGNR